MAESTPPPPAPPRPEPAIRTMHSDVSEFLATTKPSLVSLLVRQAQWEEYHSSPRPTHRQMAVGALALGLGLAIAVLFLIWSVRGPGRGGPQPGSGASSPFLAYDSTETITVAEGNERFIAAINAIGQSRHSAGAFERLDFRLQTLSGRKEPLALAAFLDLALIRLPAAVAENAAGSPQFFRYQAASSVDFGIAVELQNAGHALASLRAAEPSLARDLQPLFLGVTPPPTLAPFENRTYRNIDFRYLPMDAEGKRGIGYVYLSAKRLLIMTTSADAMNHVIERAFEAPS